MKQEITGTELKKAKDEVTMLLYSATACKQVVKQEEEMMKRRK
jgi:hypothetical protein